ncbi:zinc-dependent metalloprotease [Dyadobacter sp. CY323]|uniref:zinc-dependent metalloprotease n=1 Tax=Dyadobacter sp. CY323 TaxID=2907302 RepID=UPI001F2AFE72|nr:zinc-dependent metalloprotease [Dyadobacter sp. CY323]MCE6990620.1 zinc-dependent metalloprotease [Dyadobacter sp. CY323]
MSPKTFFGFYSRCFLMVSIFCLSTMISYAQTDDFITEIPIGEAVKSDSLIKYEQIIKRHRNIKSLTYVKVGNLAEAQKDGYLTLHLPGSNKVITAKGKSIRYFSEKDDEWIGKTDDDRETVILLANKGVIQGHISTPDGVYEIVPAPTNGLYTLQEVESTQIDYVGCGDVPIKVKKEESSAEPPAEDFHLSGQRMDPCNSQTNPRVLVLYTPSALDAAGGSIAVVESIAAMGIAQFNSTVNNSGVQSGAILSLAGVAPFGLIEDEGMGADLEKLIANGSASTLRNIFSADLVVLFTDGYYSEGDVRGISGSVKLQNERSFSIVEIWAATANKTFPHEVGYLFGCRHDGHVDIPNYAQGHNMSMAYGCGPHHDEHPYFERQQQAAEFLKPEY